MGFTSLCLKQSDKRDKIRHICFLSGKGFVYGIAKFTLG